MDELLRAGFLAAGKDASRMLHKALTDRLKEIRDRKAEIIAKFLYARSEGSNELSKLQGEEEIITKVLNAAVMAHKESE